MATNNYFGNKLTSFPQQELLNSLTREVIKINGIDVLYLPRSVIKKDTLMGEDTLSVTRIEEFLFWKRIFNPTTSVVQCVQI